MGVNVGPEIKVMPELKLREITRAEVVDEFNGRFDGVKLADGVVMTMEMCTWNSEINGWVSKEAKEPINGTYMVDRPDKKMAVMNIGKGQVVVQVGVAAENMKAGWWHPATGGEFYVMQWISSQTNSQHMRIVGMEKV
jgi:hypothetical protein